ncbi:hypothetical protein Tco_1255561 [Tanacetum coccineum]
MHVHETIVEEVVKDSGITSLGNVTFEDFYGYDTKMDADESPFDIESEIKFIRKVDLKRLMMLIILLWVLPMIKKWRSLANTGDATTNVSVASDLHISIVSASLSALGYVQALIAKAAWEKKNILRNLPIKLKQRVNSAASTIRKIVSNAISRQLPNLLIATLKYTLPKALTDAVRDTLPAFKKQIRKAIKMKMPKVVLKPLYKEFNALNKLENSVAPPISTATEGEKESQAQAQYESEPTMKDPASSQGEKQSSAPEPPTSCALVVHSNFVEPQAKKPNVSLCGV